MRIIITGFEPFGGEQINPSQQVVQALAGEHIPGIQLLGMVLPVVYEAAEPKLVAAIDDLQPDVVLSLGQAGGSSGLRLERVAINLRSTSATDPAITCSPVASSFGEVSRSKDRLLMEAEVVPGGPPAYFSTLPHWELLHAIRDAGIPVLQSFAAGTHLCNSTMYYILHHLATHHRDVPIRAGFLHLPYLHEQAAHTGNQPPPSMPLDTMLTGVRIAIKKLAGEE